MFLLFPNCLQRPLQKDLASPLQIHTHSPGPPTMGGRGQKVKGSGEHPVPDLSVGSLARCAGGTIREHGAYGKVSEGERGRKIVKIVR